MTEENVEIGIKPLSEKQIKRQKEKELKEAKNNKIKELRSEVDKLKQIIRDFKSKSKLTSVDDDIKAMCLHCNGGNRNYAADCLSRGCPLKQHNKRIFKGEKNGKKENDTETS